MLVGPALDDDGDAGRSHVYDPGYGAPLPPARAAPDRYRTKGGTWSTPDAARAQPAADQRAARGQQQAAPRLDHGHVRDRGGQGRAAALRTATPRPRSRSRCRAPTSAGRFALERCELPTATGPIAVVVKDAGDDPDVHPRRPADRARGAGATRPGVELRGGAGVGTVTKPGLGLEVGGPAINPVPRAHDRRRRRPRSSTSTEVGVVVEVSVPGGEKMARKTTNARLGIVGGISILGTTGIVRPFSTAAWRASVGAGDRRAWPPRASARVGARHRRAHRAGRARGCCPSCPRSASSRSATSPATRCARAADARARARACSSAWPASSPSSPRAC